VQGVGFRMTAVQVARDLNLSGTVKNLPDGRVELVAEGPGNHIDELLSRLREHFGGLIRKMDQIPGTLEQLNGGIRVIH
jgi:acylphosphatase